MLLAATYSGHILAGNTKFHLFFIPQDAGEGTVEELDKLRHADGNVTVAELRLEMQKVRKRPGYVFFQGPFTRAIFSF
jgi:succinate dehydrogenase/fumarate reductase flavoprotein subunit